MKIIEETVQSACGPVKCFTIINSGGAKVRLTEVGAGIMAVEIPDAQGHLDDVTIGYAAIDSYFGDGPGAGKTPGRYANRIGRGRFTLDGREYRLPVNLPPNHLHGGDKGFHQIQWKGESIGDDTVKFTLDSPDGDAGYPGNLHVEVTYRWDDDCRLRIDYLARTDAPTVVNLTNHAYWNLDGHNAGPEAALAHVLTLETPLYLATDDSLNPTGEVLAAEGTPMDFLTPKPLDRDLPEDFRPLKQAKGYDHFFAFATAPAPGELRRAARLHSRRSGRTLEVFTDQPGLQLYTGNWLTGSPTGKDGAEYTDYCSVALECQGYPDAPNHPAFPSQRIDPATPYRRTIVYAFSADEAAGK